MRSDVLGHEGLATMNTPVEVIHKSLKVNNYINACIHPLFFAFLKCIACSFDTPYSAWQQNSPLSNQYFPRIFPACDFVELVVCGRCVI
jgi:hypothetical protein